MRIDWWNAPRQTGVSRHHLFRPGGIRTHGHIAIEVDDVYQATDQIKAQGGKILPDAGPMNAGSTIIAFVEDPDGYPIELIGRKH